MIGLCDAETIAKFALDLGPEFDVKKTCRCRYIAYQASRLGPFVP